MDDPLVTLADQVCGSLSITNLSPSVVQPGETARFRVSPDVPPVLGISVAESIDLAYDPGGLPGSIGHITGDWPTPVDVRLQLEVHWTVRSFVVPATVLGGSGAPPTIASCASYPELDSTDFVAQTGLDSPELSVLLAPPVVRVGETLGVNPLRVICAKVRVAANGMWSGERHLPPLFVAVAPLAVPAVAAFFQDELYAHPGFVLLVYPAGILPLDVTQLLDELTRLDSVCSNLRSIARFAAFLTGLRILKEALRKTPRAIRIVSADIESLWGVIMRVDSFLGSDRLSRDLRAENRINSIVIIGPPGQVVRCFNAKRFSEAEGRLQIKVGPKLHVLVPSLRHPKPRSLPDGDEILDDEKAKALQDSKQVEWGDRITSIQMPAGG